MNEIVISETITYVEHTNKCSNTYEYDNPQSAVRHLLSKLTDEQRLQEFHQYCIHCGSNDITCCCMKDD